MNQCKYFKKRSMMIIIKSKIFKKSSMMIIIKSKIFKKIDNDDNNYIDDDNNYIKNIQRDR